ncbi:MAG: glutamine--fructose-6-phosphate transaminase (isomerizing) [Candidatus Omnitrophota bacterium]
MCGIVGYIGNRNAQDILIDGLNRLEYRGYDSAGIATIEHGRIFVRKKEGKLKVLNDSVEKSRLSGTIGIGHTRWATHGEPSQINAHPHKDCRGDIVVVHNGIIENFQELKTGLSKQGHHFISQTDTEVVAHLIEHYYRNDLAQAVRQAIKKIKGSYALGVICNKEPRKLIAVRHDSPLIIGIGKDENFIASDVPAILNQTKKIIYIDDFEVAVLTDQDVVVTDINSRPIRKKIHTISWDAASAEKEGYPHFMIKEINEQPQVLKKILESRIKKNKINFSELVIQEKQFKRITSIDIVACGTAYHAGLCGKYMLERFTRIPVNVDNSSEYRYRSPIIHKGKTLLIVVSQSGETADTLASLREAKKHGAVVLAICNVLGSSIARESDGVIYTYAGPEIAVASTKAYTAQLAIFYLFTLFLSRLRDELKPKAISALLSELRKVPRLMQHILANLGKIRFTAHYYVEKYKHRLAEQLGCLQDEIDDFKDKTKALMYAQRLTEQHVQKYGRRFGDFPFLYLGRNINYPSALEGALKLKEISYVSAEGYAAGEMKHGPIALIDEFPLVICIAPKSSIYDKMLSNIKEIKARKGVVVAIATEGDRELKKKEYTDFLIEIPKVNELFSPMLVILPLQLLAYYIATGLGCDIDQPRNLAKSVTVE